MKKITLLILALAFWSFNINAQTYFSEGFESGVPPTGWVDEAGVSDSDGNLWAQTISRFHTGSNSAFYDDFDAATLNDRWFITPAINLSGATAPELLYWDNVNFAGFAGTHAVKYSTDYTGSGDPTAATWTDLNTVIGTEDTWVQNGPYALPTSATVYIAFQYVGDFASEWYIDDIIVREPLACTPPTATASVVDLCGTNQFRVDVNVTNMGDASTYTLSNDYDANTVSVTGTGTWSLTFPIDILVSVTLEHDSDSACDTIFGAFTDSCPATNDDACNAIALTMDTSTNGGFYDNTGASIETNELGGSCWFQSDPASESLWFTFIAPPSGQVRISTKLGSGATLEDTQLALYSTTDCSDQTMFTQLACDEDDDNDILGTGGLQAIIDITTLTSGNTYYVQVDGFGTDVGTFDIGVFDLTNLSNETFEVVDRSVVSYFPNPVKDKLTLKAQQNIQNVSVYNMLGQEVMRTEMNLQRGELDMTSLQSGPYFVKVSINDTVETIKIIKK
jgi:hypothetical protein